MIIVAFVLCNGTKLYYDPGHLSRFYKSPDMRQMGSETGISHAQLIVTDSHYKQNADLNSNTKTMIKIKLPEVFTKLQAKRKWH